MKLPSNFIGALALLAVLSPVLPAKDEPLLPPVNLLKGKMFVSKVKGSPQIMTRERIFDAKQSDSFDASGARIETDAGAELMLILSNRAILVVGPNTRIDIRKFEQEFFGSINKAGSDIEPSTSQTSLQVVRGNLVVKTSRLLSGSSFLVTTPQASVNFRTAQAAVSATPTATSVYLVAGEATVSNRSLLDAGGTVLKKGHYAVVKQEPSGRESVARNPAGAGASPEAVVRRRTGTVIAQLPRQGAMMGVIAPGTSLPQGTEITTLADGEIYLETIPGAIAAIKANSRVLVEEIASSKSGSVTTSQASTLYLKQGQIAAIIDPAKRGINRFGIRTTKGLAVAHGTGFSVSSSPDSVSVVTTADSVSFTGTAGSTFPIQAGMASIGGGEGPMSLPSATAPNPRLAGIMQGAMDTICTLVSSNLGGISANASANLMAQTVNHAISANPDQAANFTAQAVTALSAAGSSTADSSTAAAVITFAATSATPTQAATVASAAATAAPSQAVSIAAAAATAAPEQASAIAGAVSMAVPAQAVAVASAVTTAAHTQAPGIAQAATSAAPSQAAAIAVAVSQAAPTQTAAIGAATTTAAPAQAVAIASALAQIEPTQASAIVQAVTTAARATGNVSQAAAIAVAVWQAAPTQVGQIAVASISAAPTETLAITFALAQVAPVEAERLFAAVAAATNITLQAVQAAAAQPAAAAAGAEAIQTALAASQTAAISVRTATTVTRTTAAAIQTAATASQSALVANQTAASTAATDAPTSATSASVAVSSADSASLSTIAQAIAQAVAAQDSVTFEVLPTPTGASGANNSNTIASNGNASESATTGEVVARPVVPAQLPVNIVVSPDRLPGG